VPSSKYILLWLLIQNLKFVKQQSARAAHTLQQHTCELLGALCLKYFVSATCCCIAQARRRGCHQVDVFTPGTEVFSDKSAAYININLVHRIINLSCVHHSNQRGAMHNSKKEQPALLVLQESKSRVANQP
jgi:hypothetical protein